MAEDVVIARGVIEVDADTSKADAKLANIKSKMGNSLPGKAIAFELEKAEKVLKNIQNILGQGKGLSDIASVLGVKPGSKVSISPDKGALVARIENDLYESWRKISKGKIENMFLEVYQGNRGKGLGFDIFSKQIENASKAGFKRIVMDAERSASVSGGKFSESGMSGYYAWARMGVDALLKNVPLKSAIPASLGKLKYISDLMKTKQGREFWKEHGVSYAGTFDLSPGSRSQQTLAGYAAERRDVTKIVKDPIGKQFVSEQGVRGRGALDILSGLLPGDNKQAIDNIKRSMRQTRFRPATILGESGLPGSMSLPTHSDADLMGFIRQGYGVDWKTRQPIARFAEAEGNFVGRRRHRKWMDEATGLQSQLVDSSRSSQIATDVGNKVKEARDQATRIWQNVLFGGKPEDVLNNAIESMKAGVTRFINKGTQLAKAKRTGYYPGSNIVAEVLRQSVAPGLESAPKAGMFRERLPQRKMNVSQRASRALSLIEQSTDLVEPFYGSMANWWSRSGHGPSSMANMPFRVHVKGFGTPGGRGMGPVAPNGPNPYGPNHPWGATSPWGTWARGKAIDPSLSGLYVGPTLNAWERSVTQDFQTGGALRDLSNFKFRDAVKKPVLAKSPVFGERFESMIGAFGLSTDSKIGDLARKAKNVISGPREGKVADFFRNTELLWSSLGKAAAWSARSIGGIANATAGGLVSTWSERLAGAGQIGGGIGSMLGGFSPGNSAAQMFGGIGGGIQGIGAGLGTIAGSAMQGWGTMATSLGQAMSGIPVVGGLFQAMGGLAGAAFSAIGSGFAFIGRTAGTVLSAPFKIMESIAGGAGLNIANLFGQALVYTLQGWMMKIPSILNAFFIGANAAQEQHITSMGVITGSTQLATRMVSSLYDLATQTPFEFGNITTASSRLMAFGFQAKEVIPLLGTLVDAASVSPEGMETSLQRITLALGHINTRGVVSARELNQLAMAGVPAWSILARKMNLSREALFKMVHDRGLSSAIALPLLRTGIREQFGGQMVFQQSVNPNVKSALEEMYNAGKLTEEGMNKLQTNGVQSWQILGDAIGMSVTDVKLAVSEGRITVDQFMKALNNTGAASGFWWLGGMAEKANRTLRGALSNLSDYVQRTGMELGKPFFESARMGVIAVMEWMGSKPGREYLEWLGTKTKELHTYLSTAFAGMVEFLSPMIGPIREVGLQMWEWVRPLLPFLAKVFAAEAGIRGLFWMLSNVLGIFSPLRLAIAATLAIFTPEQLRSFFSNIIGWITENKATFEMWGWMVKDILAQIPGAASNAIVSLLSLFGIDTTNTWDGIGEKIKNSITEALGTIRAAFDNLPLAWEAAWLAMKIVALQAISFIRPVIISAINQILETIPEGRLRGFLGIPNSVGPFGETPDQRATRFAEWQARDRAAQRHNEQQEVRRRLGRNFQPDMARPGFVEIGGRPTPSEDPQIITMQRELARLRDRLGIVAPGEFVGPPEPERPPPPPIPSWAGLHPEWSALNKAQQEMLKRVLPFRSAMRGGVAAEFNKMTNAERQKILHDAEIYEGSLRQGIKIEKPDDMWKKIQEGITGTPMTEAERRNIALAEQAARERAQANRHLAMMAAAMAGMQAAGPQIPRFPINEQ